MNKLDFIYNRVSVRKYKNEAIPKEDIVEILPSKLAFYSSFRC